jgi:hypothetical protein
MKYFAPIHDIANAMNNKVGICGMSYEVLKNVVNTNKRLKEDISSIHLEDGVYMLVWDIHDMTEEYCSDTCGTVYSTIEEAGKDIDNFDNAKIYSMIQFVEAMNTNDICSSEIVTCIVIKSPSQAKNSTFERITYPHEEGL